jgi:hypothetical protein
VTSCKTMINMLQRSPIQDPITPIGDWYGRDSRGFP